MSKNYKPKNLEFEKYDYDKEFSAFHDKINEIITDFNEKNEEEHVVSDVPVIPEETVITEILQEPVTKKNTYVPYYQPCYLPYYQPYYHAYYQPYFYTPYILRYQPQMYIPFGQIVMIEKTTNIVVGEKKKKSFLCCL